MMQEQAYDVVGQMVAYEAGELSKEETVKLFQVLLDTGTIWHLQGHYGRAMQALVAAGLVNPNDPATKG